MRHELVPILNSHGCIASLDCSLDSLETQELVDEPYRHSASSVKFRRRLHEGTIQWLAIEQSLDDSLLVGCILFAVRVKRGDFKKRNYQFACEAVKILVLSLNIIFVCRSQKERCAFHL